MKILITGGTVFVSRFAAAYFVSRGHDVYVINRNTRPQVPGVHLIEADRNHLEDKLKGYHFDTVLAINTYTKEDAEDLLDALESFDDFLFISSSAVYPETLTQPLREEQTVGPNAIWGAYGTNKIAAEEYLRGRVPQAYILRPPYLYGPMQNVYREPFVFECAEENRPFCLPGTGEGKLQFFHVEDLCRFMEILLKTHPQERIYNVGNPKAVSIRSWAELCYKTVGSEFKSISVTGHPQRSFFPFHEYDYCLDVSKQMALMQEVKPLEAGLQESYAWFLEHREQVNRKPLLEYIDKNILK